jgi:type VI protein secretion system component VasA
VGAGLVLVSSFHDDRRSREDNRNEARLRSERAESAHTEFKIAHLDPDRPHQDGALGAAGVAVVQWSRSLPANVHTEDPFTVFSRIAAVSVSSAARSSYDEAVHMAALWTVLAAAIDRAEHADPNTGDAA